MKRVYEIKPDDDGRVSEVLRKFAELRFEAEPGVTPGTGALAQARKAKATLHRLFGNHLSLPIWAVTPDGRVWLIER